MADDTVTVKTEVKTEVKAENGVTASNGSSGAPRPNATMFFRRLNRLYSSWKVGERRSCLMNHNC
jgi:hypothetical protein